MRSAVLAAAVVVVVAPVAMMFSGCSTEMTTPRATVYFQDRSRRPEQAGRTTVHAIACSAFMALRTNEFRWMRSFRMQAVRASFLGLPRSTNLE